MDVVMRVYAAPFDGFLELRKELVASLRAAGRKPTARSFDALIAAIALARRQLGSPK